jgi:hypothetical protein
MPPNQVMHLVNELHAMKQKVAELTKMVETRVVR